MSTNQLQLRLRVGIGCAIAGIMVYIAGCGTTSQGDFPNRLVGADGQKFLVEDLEEIANDLDLDEAGKRQAFRDLGIEDEELIDALLGL